MKDHAKLASDLKQEFQAQLSGRSEKEITRFFRRAASFARKYASAHELAGAIYLVLDNSILQAFKHRHTERGVDALAYVAFCRFARDWSDRPTHLALTPMAIYEHLGKRAVRDTQEADRVVRELVQLLADTELKTATIGFSRSSSLVSFTKAIRSDDAYLTKFIRKIDGANWQTDLQASFGVKIPLSVASRAINNRFRLKYFHPWYVQFVLSSRIENHIIKQSRHQPGIIPISSGPMSEAMADMNAFSKRSGLLQGLGDIDMLQHCDINSQYQQRLPYVKLGQTLDGNLTKVLRFRHGYYESASVFLGHPDQEQQIEKMVSMLVKRPFAELEERGAPVRHAFMEFAAALVTLCESCQPKASVASGAVSG